VIFTQVKRLLMRSAGCYQHMPNFLIYLVKVLFSMLINDVTGDVFQLGSNRKSWVTWVMGQFTGGSDGSQCDWLSTLDIWHADSS